MILPAIAGSHSRDRAISMTSASECWIPAYSLFKLISRADLDVGAIEFGSAGGSRDVLFQLLALTVALWGTAGIDVLR